MYRLAVLSSELALLRSWVYDNLYGMFNATIPFTSTILLKGLNPKKGVFWDIYGISTKYPMSPTQQKTEPIPTLKVVFPDRSLRERFKGICALNGKNMNEVIIEFVRQYIEQNEPFSSTETKTPSATKAKQGKVSKEAS